MATNESTTKLKVDISDLKKNITEANRQIRLANAEFKAASTGMDNWQKSTNGLSSKINQLNTVLGNQKKVLDSYYKELELVKQQYGEDSKEADNLKIRIANQESAINKTTSELKKYEDELKRVEAEESKLGQAGDKLQTVGDKMSSVGATLSKTVTAAVVALGAAAIKAFTEVDKGLDIVASKTGATGEELKGMQDITKGIATSINVSFEDAGSAVGEVNTRFGVTGDKLQDLSTRFLKFAKLNNTDVSTSIDLVQKSLATFGLTTDDAGAMLDTLNKVGQDTGISVDKLAQSLVTNGSTLKEMGFNAAQSATFLGKLEKSGIDSSQALTGLKMALKNATKDGKSMQDAISELQTRIKGAGSSTEAMSIAMELFGNKAGASLGSAIYDGTMNLEDLTSALGDLNDNLGNVDKTFESTQDGVDKMKVAWNSTKLAGYELGSAIGKTLAPIMEKIADFAIKVAKEFEGLDDDTKDLIVKSGLLAAAIGPVLVAGGKLLVGLGNVMKVLPTIKTAITSLNATMLASPIGLITAAIAAATVAGIAYANAVNNEAEAEYGLSQAQKSNLDGISQLKSSYDSMNESRKSSTDAVNNEFAYIKNLKDEYNGLIDNNGQIKAGYEDRANFILNQLASALGMEVSQIREQIDANGQLSSAIDQVIEKKRAEALLSANQEAYNQAIKDRTEAFNKYVQAQNDVAEAEKNWHEIQGEYNSALDTYNQILTIFGATAAQKYYSANYMIFASGQKAKESYDMTRFGLEAAREAYVGYNNTIQNYEGLSSAIISGDAAKINEAMLNMSFNFKTAENSDRESLEQQVRDMETNYQNMQRAIQNNAPGVTQEMVNQSKTMVDQSKIELQKLEGDATQAGQQAGLNYASGLGSQTGTAEWNAAVVAGSADNAIHSTGDFGGAGSSAGGSYAWGVASKQGDARSAGQGLGNEAKSGADEGGSGSYTSGSFFGQGFFNGIGEWFDKAFNQGRGLALQALFGLRKGQQEGSPSKITTQSGRFFGEGYEIGINNTIKSVVKAATNLAQEAIEALDSESDGFDLVGANAGDSFAQGLRASLVDVNKTISSAAVPIDFNSPNVSMTSGQNASIGTGASVVNNYYTFEQTNNSPKALSTIDIYRQTRNQFSQLKGATL